MVNDGGKQLFWESCGLLLVRLNPPPCPPPSRKGEGSELDDSLCRSQVLGSGLDGDVSRTETGRRTLAFSG